jgi:hypothetical protein
MDGAIDCQSQNPLIMLQLVATDPASKARRGRLTTAHGVIETPVNFGQTGHT